MQCVGVVAGSWCVPALWITACRKMDSEGGRGGGGLKKTLTSWPETKKKKKPSRITKYLRNKSPNHWVHHSECLNTEYLSKNMALRRRFCLLRVRSHAHWEALRDKEEERQRSSRGGITERPVGRDTVMWSMSTRGNAGGERGEELNPLFQALINF